MSTDSSYTSFILDNEEYFIFPSQNFSTQEIKARLKEMNINDNNTRDREYLKHLYDSAIQDYSNRLKIINQLKRDTSRTISRLNLSETKPFPYNMNTSNDISQKKEANMSYEINNRYPHMRENTVNLRKPKIIIKMINDPQNPENKYINRLNQDMNEHRLNLNNLNQPNIGYNYNNRQIVNDNNKYGNYPYDVNNLKQNNEYNNNYNNINNNTKNLNEYHRNNQYEEINPDINDDRNETNKRNPNQEKLDQIAEKIKNYNFKRRMNNIHIIPESKYENVPEEYENDSDNNNLNYNNQYKSQTINIIPKKINFQQNINNADYQPNKIQDERIDLNSQNKLKKNQIETNNNNSFINALYQGIEVRNKDNNDNNNNENNNNKNQKNKKENNIDKKDDDEKSSFSIFSAFENFKKNPLYKYRKFILIHIIILLIFLIISISLLHLIYNYRENIINFFSDIFNILCQPRRILDLLTSFISVLFLGPIHYWYISIPVLILLFVFYIYMRKYLFKKRCKEILEKIVKHLKNDENNYISEIDIYKRFVQPYGISYDKFLKKYLVQLHKLRRNDNRLKLSSMKKDEKIIVFWELSE